MSIDRSLALGTVVILSALSNPVIAQNESEDDATVTYPASYFAEYGVVSVNDMLSRIPGIGLALEGNQVPSFNNNNRGLGESSQILINGKRLAGKANEESSQLDRIAAEQVDYIEIIRGSSGELDVRNSGQLVNIVLSNRRVVPACQASLGSLTFTMERSSLMVLFHTARRPALSAICLAQT